MTRGRIEAVIFDLDGVLVDTEPFFHAAINAFVAPSELTNAQYARILGMSDRDTTTLLREQFGFDEPLEALHKRRVEFVYQKLQAAILAPLEGAVVLLDALEVAGCAVAMASGSPRPWVEATLRAIGLADRFPLVVTGSDVTAGKPAPDIYLLAAGRLDVPPIRCLAIEDSVPGLLAASAAGMTSVQLRQSSLVPPPQSSAQAVIDSYADFDLGWLDGAPFPVR